MVGKGGFISMEWQTRGLEALPRYVAINVKEFVKEPVREINHHHLNLTGLCQRPTLCMSLCHILRLTWQSATNWYLKITEMYALIALEARRLRSGYQQDHARRGSARASLLDSGIARDPQPDLVCTHIVSASASAVRQHSPCVFTPPSFCASLSLCLYSSSYKNTSYTGLRSAQKPHLNLQHLRRPHFQIRSKSQYWELGLQQLLVGARFHPEHLETAEMN